jgi:hypothetical protein
MRFVTAVLASFLLILAGCLSAPIPQELTDVNPAPGPEALLTKEVVRLSKAGVTDEVLIELIRIRGVADLPSLATISSLRVSSQVQLALITAPAGAPARKPEPRIVYRELFIPFWPSYSGGRWHLALRLGCYVRTEDREGSELVPPEPEPSVPLPRLIDP